MFHICNVVFPNAEKKQFKLSRSVLEKQGIFAKNTLNYSKIRTRNTQSILQKHQNSNELIWIFSDFRIIERFNIYYFQTTIWLLRKKPQQRRNQSKKQLQSQNLKQQSQNQAQNHLQKNQNLIKLGENTMLH
ncbi:MAG: hypothetical protein EA439_03105 [Nitrosopumilus sp.]|nr:MAG: hypothetical protein EA439_03105 [Nitrosopumilus sp.]